MVGVNDRNYDVKDILDKAATGWVAPPTKPYIEVEQQLARRGYAIRHSHTNGQILILKNYTYNSEKISPTVEDRIWTFPCMIISQSAVLLQGMFDQMREVFDRYTSVPWSTSTLGTSTTYSYARIESGEVDQRISKYVMDVNVILCEYTVDVVIA